MIQRLVLFLGGVLLATSAHAVNSGLSYEGQIIKPNGDPLSGTAAQFKIQIRTPDNGSCVMYEEVKVLNLAGSGGNFSLTINDGTVARSDSSGLPFERIFANQGSFALNPATCATGSGAYTPNANDGRKLFVWFKDETMGSWEPIPDEMINYVPFAVEAKQVGGFSADSLLKVVNASGEPLTGVGPLSNAQYTELLALVNGSSAAFTKLGGVALPTMTSGEVLGWNGTSWVSQPAVAGPNSVSTTMLQNGSVDSTKLAGNVSISTTGTLSSAVATTRDFKLFAAAPSAFFIGHSAPALAASYTLTWPMNAGSSNQYLKTDGAGNLSWDTVTGSGITSLTGDVTGTGPGATAATVAAVGGSSASLIHSAELAANGATTLDTANTIVKRDGSGNVNANVGTLNGLALNNAGSLLNIVNPVGGAWTMTLPANAGSSGQMLTTNGSGTLSWVTPSSSPWTVQAPGINYMGGNVGIGTTSPTNALTVFKSGAGAPLSVNGNGGTGPGGYINLAINNTASGAYKSSVEFQNNGNPKFTMGVDYQGNGTNNFQIFDNVAGAQRLFIDPSGKIGVGTTSPSVLLDVNGSVHVAGSLKTDTYITAALGTGNAPSYVIGTSGQTGLYSPLNDAIGISTGGFERIRISPSGSIGIGTSAPIAALDVSSGTTGIIVGADQGSNSRTNGTNKVGTIVVPSFAGGNPAFMIGQVSSSTANDLFLGDNGGSLTGATAIHFLTKASATDTSPGTERLTITSGNVGIGTTSPGSRLEVNSGVAGAAVGLALSTTTAGANTYQQFKANGSVIGSISSAAGVNVAYNTTSDVRLKGGFKAVASPLKTLNDIEVSNFYYLADPAHRQDGFKAQQLYTVLPYAVVKPAVEVDNDGKLVPWLADYSKVVPLVTAAVQQLSRELTALNSEVSEKSRKIAELEQKNADQSAQIELLKAYLCAKDPAAAFCN